MQVAINGRPLSDTQKAVLRRGYCVLHVATPRWECSGLTYQEWADLCAAGLIKHQKSCLHPDRNPDIAWERYRVTQAGKACAAAA